MDRGGDPVGNRTGAAAVPDSPAQPGGQFDAMGAAKPLAAGAAGTCATQGMGDC